MPSKSQARPQPSRSIHQRRGRSSRSKCSLPRAVGPSRFSSRHTSRRFHRPSRPPKNPQTQREPNGPGVNKGRRRQSRARRPSSAPTAHAGAPAGQAASRRPRSDQPRAKEKEWEMVRRSGKGSNPASDLVCGETTDLDTIFEELANWEAQLRHLDLSTIEPAAGPEVRP